MAAAARSSCQTSLKCCVLFALNAYSTPMESRRTLYDDLGVAPSASPGRIKAAYDNKVNELAAENGPLAQRERDSMTRAYQTLSDPDRREQYNTLMGLPQYVPPSAQAAAKSGGIPLWLVGAGFALLALCALPFVWKPKAAGPVVIETPPPPVSSAPLEDPTAPVIRPLESAKSPDEQRRYDEQVKREFDSARRSYEYQQQREQSAAAQFERTEKYKAETEKRKVEYEAQRERFQREQERRDLEMRQRQELERAKRQLQELQQPAR
jgi:hypothetical protein